MIHPNDILTRNKTTWLAQSFLLRTCPGLSDELMRKSRSIYKASVSPSFHSRDVLPDTGKAWRWATINNTFYYAYDNIPDKAPANYRSQLPSKTELQNTSPHTQQSNLSADLLPYITTHYTSYLHCYGDCTKTQQTNLAKAAATMEGAVTCIRANNINIKKYAFFEQLAAFIERHDVAYFGSNVRVIKKKIEEVLEGAAITDVIKLPRADNANASKNFHDEEIRSWVLQLRDMGQNFTNAFIIRKIKDMCTLTSRPCPKDRWIGGIMEEHNTGFLTAQQRYGNKGRFSAIYRGYQPFQNALFAGDCWQVDGTRVNLVAHDDGEKGKQFLYIIAVRDVHSGEVLGWHFDVTEDRWAVFNAIKMAVKEAGYLPYEMVFDKFPGHNTPEMISFFASLQTTGTKVTISSDPNVKPGLERWFGTLQTVFMQDSKYYYGQGVKSRRNYAHRSEEFIKRVKREAHKAGFNWEQAVTEATNVLEAYRSTAYCQWSRKHKTVQQSPAQLHEISPKPNVITLEAQDYWYLFGLKVMLPHRMGLFKKEIQGAEFYYRTADYEVISKHSHAIVCYDMDDLSQVMLYAATKQEITNGKIDTSVTMRRFLGRAAEEVPAQRFGPGADVQEVGRRKALIKELQGFTEQEAEFRKAVGYDITEILAPMSVSKHQAERAETAYLSDNASASYVDNRGIAWDDEDIDINVRNQY